MKKLKNPMQERLITELKELASSQKVNFWKRIAKELERPTRNKRIVNLSKLDRVTKGGDFVLVPGKVLSSGELTHKLSVSAFSFSQNAKLKILKNGEVFSIEELMKKNPKAKGIKLIG